MVSCELGVDERRASLCCFKTLPLATSLPFCSFPEYTSCLDKIFPHSLSTSQEAIMDPINQTSDNSIAGHTANDIPNDGTGMFDVGSVFSFTDAQVSQASSSSILGSRPSRMPSRADTQRPSSGSRRLTTLKVVSTSSVK